MIVRGGQPVPRYYVLYHWSRRVPWPGLHLALRRNRTTIIAVLSTSLHFLSYSHAQNIRGVNAQYGINVFFLKNNSGNTHWKPLRFGAHWLEFYSTARTCISGSS